MVCVLTGAVGVQGKWVIEPSSDGAPNRHSLKYAVELVVHARPFRFLGIMEPIIERGIVEDIPSSLAAIRRAAEGRRGRRGAAPARGRAAVARADRVFEHFEELRAELTALYGDRQQLPNRKELLASGRCGALLPLYGHLAAPAHVVHACRQQGERRDRRSVGQRFTVAAATGPCGVCTQVFQTTHGGVCVTNRRSWLRPASAWPLTSAKGEACIRIRPPQGVTNRWPASASGGLAFGGCERSACASAVVNSVLVRPGSRLRYLLLTPRVPSRVANHVDVWLARRIAP